MAEDSYMDDKILTTEMAVQEMCMGKQTFLNYFRDLGCKGDAKSITYSRRDLYRRWHELKDGDHGRV